MNWIALESVVLLLKISSRWALNVNTSSQSKSKTTKRSKLVGFIYSVIRVLSFFLFVEYINQKKGTRFRQANAAFDVKVTNGKWDVVKRWTNDGEKKTPVILSQSNRMVAIWCVFFSSFFLFPFLFVFLSLFFYLCRRSPPVPFFSPNSFRPHFILLGYAMSLHRCYIFPLHNTLSVSPFFSLAFALPSWCVCSVHCSLLNGICIEMFVFIPF